MARSSPSFLDTSKTTLVQYYGLGVFYKFEINPSMFAAVCRLV